MKVIFLFFSLFYCASSYSQDHDFIEAILNQGEKSQDELLIQEKTHFEVAGKSYFLDLLHSEGLEKVFIEKKDGQDVFNVFTPTHEPIFSLKLSSKGPYSRIYKLSYRDISAQEKLLILYHFEGVNKYLKLQSTSRLYFITWNPKKNNSFQSYKGPVIWNELKDVRDRYFQRKRLLQVLDLDQNGYKDIVVKYGRTSLSYAYFGQGKWKQPKD